MNEHTASSSRFHNIWPPWHVNDTRVIFIVPFFKVSLFKFNIIRTKLIVKKVCDKDSFHHTKNDGNLYLVHYVKHIIKSSCNYHKC